MPVAMATAILAATEACSLFTDLSGFTGPADAAEDRESPGDGGDPSDARDGGSQPTNDAATSRYASVVLADRPLVYLRLGEAPGRIANDATGNGNSGALGSGHVFGVPGVIVRDPDTALRLDGTTSGIDLGKKFDFPGTQPYSLEIWAKVDLVDMTFRHFFQKAAFPAGGRQSYGVFVWNGLFVYERVIGGTNLTVQLDANKIAGRWAHLVATYDGAFLRTYIDGLEAGKTADSRAAGAINQTLYAGCNTGFDNGVIKGDLDEVAVYDQALSAERVQIHYDTGSGLR